jgi:hypothetical protein
MTPMTQNFSGRRTRDSITSRQFKCSMLPDGRGTFDRAARSMAKSLMTLMTMNFRYERTSEPSVVGQFEIGRS